jgi:transcription elongation factor GreB
MVRDCKMHPSEKNYISQQGFDRLKSEYDTLLLKERPEIVKVVQWAASNGDRSENADYLYGKKRMREIDRRLSFLKKRLESAVVVDYLNYLDAHKALIRFGATVNLGFIDEMGNIKEKRLTIVGVDEIDLAKNYLSWKSPIGSALMGKNVGDLVSVKTPQGELEYEVLSFEYIAYD